MMSKAILPKLFIENLMSDTKKFLMLVYQVALRLTAIKPFHWLRLLKFLSKELGKLWCQTLLLLGICNVLIPWGRSFNYKV